MSILKNKNISYSLWSTYKKSQLQFYFQYIAKPKDNLKEIHQVYGDAGNVVHSAIEDFIKTDKPSFTVSLQHKDCRGFSRHMDYRGCKHS